MTLSFTQTIDGKPNFFIEKVWASLLKSTTIGYAEYLKKHYEKFNVGWDNENSCLWPNEEINAKLHTIREYRKTKTGERAAKQWKAGDLIHPAINPRSANYFQFAPVLECKSVQTILIQENIVYFNNIPFRELHVIVDGKEIDAVTWNQLAINDGFDSPIDFINYFSKNVERQLIHWTDLKY